MPKAVERELSKAADKMAAKGTLKKKKKGTSLQDAKKQFVYATMTNMQKAGSIPPWRKLK